MSSLALYHYFRSSASFRVRTALNWKGLEYEDKPVHLLNNGGEQNAAEFLKINPMGEVPVLVHDGFVVGQTMAIFDYLDRAFPQMPLFPADPKRRARVIQFAENINAGIHPIQNLKVLNRLTDLWQATPDDRTAWAGYWIQRGFVSLEKMLENTAGKYCFGDDVTAADMFLVPQVFNAKRFSVDLAPFPCIQRVTDHALALPAFERAQPENVVGGGA